MIAVCFLTCGTDRFEVARETAASFVAINAGRGDILLLHADAGGPGARDNLALAAALGFTTIHAPADRVGQIESFRAFMAFVDLEPSIDALLWLENDWASERPIPSVDFLRRWPAVDQFRLYGDRKMKGDGPRALAGTCHIATKIPLSWNASTAAPGWEFGFAHWGAGGTIVRPTALEHLVHLPRLKDVILATDLDTMRPRENILWHIGENTTAGFFG